MFRVRSAVDAWAISTRTTRAEMAALRPPTATLTISASAGSPPQTVEVRRDVLVIGRGSDADVRLSRHGVSRRHAEIRLEGDDVVFVDLGSTNGSMINGRPVERRPAQPG